MNNPMYLVTLSQYAKSQVEERTENNLCNSKYTGRDYSILVGLCTIGLIDIYPEI